MSFKAQETSFTCGPAAMRNCLIQLELETISELKLRELCHTNKDGTHMAGLIKGAKSLNLEFKEVYSRSADVFGRKLLKALKAKHPCIVLTDATAHWIAAIEYKHRKIKIVDTEFASLGGKRIDQSMTLKDFKLMAHNFNKFTKKDYFHFLEIWVP